MKAPKNYQGERAVIQGELMRGCLLTPSDYFSKSSQFGAKQEYGVKVKNPQLVKFDPQTKSYVPVNDVDVNNSLLLQALKEKIYALKDDAGQAIGTAIAITSTVYPTKDGGQTPPPSTFVRVSDDDPHTVARAYLEKELASDQPVIVGVRSYKSPNYANLSVVLESVAVETTYENVKYYEGVNGAISGLQVAQTTFGTPPKPPEQFPQQGMPSYGQGMPQQGMPPYGQAPFAPQPQAGMPPYGQPLQPMGMPPGMQPQQTGFDPNAQPMGMPPGMQPQQTGFDPNAQPMGMPPQPPQQAGFDPNAQPMGMAPGMPPQQTGFDPNAQPMGMPPGMPPQQAGFDPNAQPMGMPPGMPPQQAGFNQGAQTGTPVDTVNNNPFQNN